MLLVADYFVYSFVIFALLLCWWKSRVPFYCSPFHQGLCYEIAPVGRKEKFEMVKLKVECLLNMYPRSRANH